jgi:hypothetical protein
VPPEDAWAKWRARVNQLLATLRDNAVLLVLAVLGGSVAVLFLRRALPSLLVRRRNQRQRRRDSEARYYRALERSARSGDADVLVRDYWRWRDRLARETPTLSRDALRQAAESSGFGERWRELERGRYAEGAPPADLAALIPTLRAFRKALRAAARGRSGQAAWSLLNPRGNAS